MTYRDELHSAYRRISELERELEQAGLPCSCNRYMFATSILAGAVVVMVSLMATWLVAR